MLYSAILTIIGLEPSSQFQEAYSTLALFLAAWWQVAEMERRHLYTPTFDTGWFSMAFFPIYTLYHLSKTRGWRGSILLIGLVAIVFAPAVGIAAGAVIGHFLG